MRWNSVFSRNEIKGLFVRDAGRMATRHVIAMEQIREAMRDCIDSYDGQGVMSLKDRLNQAKDLQDLWYMRGDVLAHIAGVAGETKAREETEVLSSMFKGLLPRGLASRPSPLSS